jgi:hypothetical protein
VIAENWGISDEVSAVENGALPFFVTVPFLLVDRFGLNPLVSGLL